MLLYRCCVSVLAAAPLEPPIPNLELFPPYPAVASHRSLRKRCHLTLSSDPIFIICSWNLELTGLSILPVLKLPCIFVCTHMHHLFHKSDSLVSGTLTLLMLSEPPLCGSPCLQCPTLACIQVLIRSLPSTIIYCAPGLYEAQYGVLGEMSLLSGYSG